MKLAFLSLIVIFLEFMQLVSGGYIAVSKINADVIMPPMKGMTLNAWSAEAYNSSDCDQSIANLAGIKSNWVLLTVFWFMDTYRDVDMHRRPDLYTASDSSVIHAIQRAHGLGLEVALKPMVDVVDGTWRGQIVPSDWALWFENYRSFINYYAVLAENNDVGMFVVGTELRSSQTYETEWRQVIADAHVTFSGPLTYAANWDSYGTGSIRFWDALDYVGVDAYFPLTDSFSPSLSQLMSAWSHCMKSGYISRNWVNELYQTYVATGRKILFSEIGYCSQDGTNTRPWDWNISPNVDLQEQADCYQAALEVFHNKTWFNGWFWWNWETDPDAGGPSEKHYTPQNKPAQNILNQYYYEIPPDIAVTNIALRKLVVGNGYSLGINVTVQNQGLYPETFNLTILANEMELSTSAVVLENGASSTMTFSWNTSGFVNGVYALSAYAVPIAFEVDVSDNTRSSDENVSVSIPGDVDANGHIDILDVVKITSIYSLKLGESFFNSNSDIDDDGIISILDVVICTGHYGQSG